MEEKRINKELLPLIAITAGDPNGVGYEILLQAVAHPHILRICRPVIYGNLHIAKQRLPLLDEEFHNLQLTHIENINQAQNGKISVIDCYPDNTPIHLGHSTPEGGKASFLSLERATNDILTGKVHGLVTAPINKENIQSDSFQFSGHTEYLTHKLGEGKESLMMMVSDQMRVALVSNHTPIRKVPQFITVERILNKLTLLNTTLQNDFTIRKPRIAVLALNPHAGDNGLLGTEEEEIIKPAIQKANEAGIWAFGPYSADGFFGSGKYTQFDAILAMYHDQGLIPFKSIDMAGVNYTAGLKYVRTSPDHGTAYDLAGQNIADSTSFRNALYMAIELPKTRAMNQALEENKMIIQERPKRERPERQPLNFKD